MSRIIKYQDENGNIQYKATVYIGTNQITGEQSSLRLKGFTTVQEALLAVNQTKKEHDLAIDLKNMKFVAVFAGWLAEDPTFATKPKKMRAITWFVNYFLPCFANRRIDRITLAQIKKTLKKIDSDYRYSGMIISIFTYAYENGYLKRNPVTEDSLVENNPINDHSEISRTKSAIDQLLQVIPTRRDPVQHAFFKVLEATGMTASECLALSWGDIDTVGSTIRINKRVSTDARGHNMIKHLRNSRIIKVNYRHLDCLMAIRPREFCFFNDKSNRKRIFHGHANSLLSTQVPQRWLNGLTKASNIPHLCTRNFREIHALACFANGMSITEVQYRLGHTSKKSTIALYRRLTQQDH
ncbi:tyrosine-type recombinase/integrase [Lacticaseibacillus saniviri]